MWYSYLWQKQIKECAPANAFRKSYSIFLTKCCEALLNWWPHQGFLVQLQDNLLPYLIIGK